MDSGPRFSVEAVKLLAAMLQNSSLKERVEVTWYRDGWPAKSAALEEADTLVIISDGRDGDRYDDAPHLESPARVAEVQRLIDRGCGLITFHFSTFTPDAYGEAVLDWTGGYFDWQTDGRREWYSAIQTLEARVHLADTEHPVNRGLAPFTMKEEFYYNLRLASDAPGWTPLWVVPALEGRSPYGNVVAWAHQRPDGGRGFGTSCGHFYDNWRHPQLRKLLLNAIAWTAHLKVPPNGVEAPYLERNAIEAALPSAPPPPGNKPRPDPE